MPKPRGREKEGDIPVGLKWERGYECFPWTKWNGNLPGEVLSPTQGQILCIILILRDVCFQETVTSQKRTLTIIST
jgi:hypothetical protein